MSRFTIRQFQSGDEADINQLYLRVTGSSRSIEQYLWQWHQAPSGSGDIWLIHDSEDGNRLIGHHGVMPIRFTRGTTNLLFGKIENTMVLPEYREKILYTRYELRFKRDYEDRYHALFATVGPASAIRIRKAGGYDFPVEWRSYMLGTSLWSNINCSIFLLRAVLRRGFRSNKNIGKNLSGSNRLDAGFLSPDQAASDKFFDNFWEQARGRHGIAPRRNKEDLLWKFWTNPYKQHFTCVVDDDSCQGFAIVSLAGGIAKLEDYAVSHPTQVSYQKLFDELLDRLHYNSVKVLRVVTTNDDALSTVLSDFADRELACGRLINKIMSNERRMPRLITKMGALEGLSSGDWHVTGLIFEGR